MHERAWVLCTAHLIAHKVTGCRSGGGLILDGPLGPVAFNQLGGVETAPAAITVRQTSRLFHASASRGSQLTAGRLSIPRPAELKTKL